MRRGPNSASRLGAAAQRPQALTRTKTNESAGQPSQERQADPSTPIPPITPPIPKSAPFTSQIYCSQACAKHEADRSTDLARRMSVDSSLHLVTSNLPTSSGSKRSPNGPSSPLYISGSSDTSSSGNEANAAQAATSAPNFFDIHRDAEEAWREVNRQRRSSVHPSFRPGPATGFGMRRDTSQSSGSFTTGERSSDSLNSVWVEGAGADLHLGRTVSGQGVKRMSPVTEHVPMTGRWPIMGFNSSRTSASLSSSHGSDHLIPAEFGSAPEHTLNLWHSYTNAFSHRDTNPSVPRISTTPTHPGMPRRTSSSTLQRPIGGTIRAKSKTDVSWDSFGLNEVNSKKKSEKVQVVESSTPKQHISIGERGCIISYGTPPMSRSLSEARDHPGALAIPTSTRGGSTISPGRTPTITTNTPNPRTQPTSSDVPDLAGLRIGAGSTCNPYMSTSHVAGSSSGPKSTWNWSKYEKEGGRTYNVPELMQKAGAAKQGLFFFK